MKENKSCSKDNLIIPVAPGASKLGPTLLSNFYKVTPSLLLCFGLPLWREESMCDTDAYASDVAENPDPEADADALCGDELAHSDEAESDIRGGHEHNEVEENQSQHVDHNSNLQNGDQDEARNHLQVFAQPLLDVATVNQRPHPNPNPVHAEDNNDNDQIWPEITGENNRIGGDGGLENASIAIKFLELKKKLQLANTELAAKEVQIKQLETKVLSQTDQIEVIKMERNSYRKELDTCQGNDLYLPQIKALENSLVQKDTEIRAMKDKLAAQEVTAKRTMANMQSEHKAQMDQMAKMCEDSKREKESMVMKFAQAEHKGLDMQKTTEKLETRLKDVLKDKDILLGKLSSLRAERQKIVSRLDNKASEYGSLQRELEKQKELVSTIENRMKWTQNKLSAEIESHKETKVMLQTANTKLKESKEECEQIRRDCQDIIKTYQESEEIKSNSLDNQLKAKESELKVQEQEKNDQQEIHSLVVKELESLKVQHKDVLEELKTMKDKVTCLEDECRDKEDTLSKFKDVLQNQKARIKELRTRLKELEDIKSDYDRGQVELSEMEKTLQEQKQICKDIEADIESCKKRESELLELTSNLSAKNAQLQSDNITVSNKVLSLEDSCNSMKLRIQELETKSQELHNDLIEEKQKRQEETTSLAEQLHDKTKAVEELSVQLEEEKDDMRTLKRKHANNIKDLTRQLTQSRRKLETYENTGEKDSTSLGSRTSSNGSLNTLDSNVIHRNGNPDQEYPVITEQVEVDKQVLIERIVKLQKSHARKSDKIEFMEDHINHLIDDIQRKKRIIQSYALREEVGVLAPEYMDKNKAVLSRKGGIMASLYNSQPADQSMTLDLSLEINSKLQSVLEDTLLKNITLKDSLDTLGKEIARLSQENRQLQLQLQNNK
ncbi:Coiled-coil domain-containing protein 186 [Acanthosepion pharaonis]|uniref:Coiled-coil domain-containing protein 186 n=1 Tax=Acanthosepion pharaonis TaxID=158019 RepID=A0A812C3C6_ACAPH|nr:Coiled-coil domain-containing protein 186 [Sepia pharaonis]